MMRLTALISSIVVIAHFAAADETRGDPAMMRGYNIFLGNPNENSYVKMDPGFMRQIWKGDNAVSSSSLDRSKCSVGFESKCVASTAAYQMDIESEVNVPETDKGLTGSASNGLKKYKELFNNEEKVLVITHAECPVSEYVRTLSDLSTDPLTNAFVDAVMETDFTVDSDIHEIFDKFGTHFARKIVTGSRNLKETVMPKSSLLTDDMFINEMDAESESSFARIASKYDKAHVISSMDSGIKDSPTSERLFDGNLGTCYFDSSAKNNFMTFTFEPAVVTSVNIYNRAWQDGYDGSRPLTGAHVMVCEVGPKGRCGKSINCGQITEAAPGSWSVNTCDGSMVGRRITLLANGIDVSNWSNMCEVEIVFKIEATEEHMRRSNQIKILGAEPYVTGDTLAWPASGFTPMPLSYDLVSIDTLFKASLLNGKAVEGWQDLDKDITRAMGTYCEARKGLWNVDCERYASGVYLDAYNIDEVHIDENSKTPGPV